MTIEKYAILKTKDAPVDGPLYDTLDDARRVASMGDWIAAVIFEYTDTELVERI